MLFEVFTRSATCTFVLATAQANLWQQITANGPAPSPRRRRSMVWSDSAGGFYIFGGYDGCLDAGAKSSDLFERGGAASLRAEVQAD